ncbi:amino acid ABC transporter substrate-binding protein [Flaviflagellibacter deserti]|uniref:Amino acid ABC transporter substrate-binding protein n=1 Tax=Flaviflagellibacter deserti TaxID=2267266 RepID=A0ABV9Z734_9HYPH
MKKHLLPVILGLAGAAMTAGVASAATLDSVKAKGFVQCGVNTGLPGFAAPDDKGNWTGLDVDYCKAVAAVVFGDSTKVKFTPLSAKDRFTALQSGEIDMLSRNTTWTMSRDTQMGLTFAGVNYYDGQGFIVKKALGVDSALKLDGASICVQSGTTTELNLADYFAGNNIKFTPVVFEKVDEVNAAYEAGRCDAMTTDASGLYAYRLTFQQPDAHIVLPEIISKEPLGPVVRAGDVQWLNIVKWTHDALLEAEEYGITSKNVDELKKSSTNPNVKRILAADDSKFGEAMGVPNTWAYTLIKQMGNYGEIFDRNVGAGSPLKIERGLNALWSKGGLQYSPPIR